MVRVVEEPPVVAKGDGAEAVQGDAAVATRQISLVFNKTTIIPNDVASLVQLHTTQVL